MPPESVTYNVRADFCSSTTIPFAPRLATKSCHPTPSQWDGLVCCRGMPMSASGATGHGGMMPGFTGLMSKGLCLRLLFIATSCHSCYAVLAHEEKRRVIESHLTRASGACPQPDQG